MTRPLPTHADRYFERQLSLADGRPPQPGWMIRQIWKLLGLLSHVVFAFWWVIVFIAILHEETVRLAKDGSIALYISAVVWLSVVVCFVVICLTFAVHSGTFDQAVR